MSLLHYECFRYVAIWDRGFIKFQHKLKSNPGYKVQKKRILWDKSVPYFQQESGPCPLDWRRTIHWNIAPVFFQQSWHMWSCWKIARARFQCMVVLQSRGPNSNWCHTQNIPKWRSDIKLWPLPKNIWYIAKAIWHISKTIWYVPETD